jgi:hypothetical protein
MIKIDGIRMCEYPGCHRKSRNKGKVNGKTIYGRYCQQHHKSRVDTPFGKQILENKTCEVCGWDKAPCDRHRENSEKGYTKTNVHILCPNCHRLVTLGLIEIKGNN